MNAKIPAEVALKKFLEAAAQPDDPQPDDPKQAHRAETLDCLSLSQLGKHLESKIVLADEQLEHIARCAQFCQRNVAYLREYGGYRVLLGETVKQLLEGWKTVKDNLIGYAKAVTDSARLRPVWPETVFSTSPAQPKPPAYPVLIEEAAYEAKCRVTRGRIKDGRFIARLSFDLPLELAQEVSRQHPVQLCFVGKDAEVFNALDLPGVEDQLINIQLPDRLADKELDATDPLPCALALRFGKN